MSSRLGSPLLTKWYPGTTMSIFQGVADRDKDDIVVYLAAQK
jgi:hypothetical protein